MMNYIFFAWVASIVFGVEVVIGKFTSNRTVTNPWLFNFMWSMFIIILILPFAIANHVGLPHITLNLLLVALFYAVANIFYIVSLKLMDVTAMGPLFNFRSVFSVILGVIMLGEKITVFQIVLIGIIFMAGVIVNIDEKLKLKAFFRIGMLAVMGLLLTLSFMGIYTNLAIAESGFWSTTLWSMVLAQIMFLVTVPLFWKDLVHTNVKKYTGLLVMSVASAGGTLAANQAYASNVGISSTILSLPFSMIFTIIISRINPKLLEHHTAKIYAIRVIGAAVMLVAALQLSK
jgi:drug/metabolite transporter (DMT)-like permease